MILWNLLYVIFLFSLVLSSEVGLGVWVDFVVEGFEEVIVGLDVCVLVVGVLDGVGLVW